MGLYSIKPRFQKTLLPISNFFIKNKISPTTINVLALIISLTGAIALAFSEKYIFLLLYIPVMAVIRTALNALDGMVARQMNAKNKEYGEVLNEFFDRVSDVLIFGSFILISVVVVEFLFISIILVLLNSYLGIVSKAAGGKRIYSGLIGKADRMFLISLFCVLTFITNDFNFMNYFVLVLIIGTLISLFQRFNKIKKDLKK